MRRLLDAPLDLLRAIMDEDDLTAALQATWPWPGEAVEFAAVEAARLRDDGSMDVDLEVVVAGELRRLNGQIVCGDATEAARRVSDRLRRSTRQQIPWAGGGPRVWAAPELGLVVRELGLDERLVGLKLLHRPKLVRPTIGDLIGVHSKHDQVGVEILSHRLHKRLTARFRGDEGSVIVKFYKTRSDLAHTAMNHLLQLDGVELERRAVPRPLRLIAEWNATVTEDVPGVAVAQQPDGRGLAEAGAALGWMQTSGVRVAASHDVAAEVDLLEDRVALAGRLRPAAATGLASALDAVTARLRTLERPLATVCHRDFKPDQVLVAAGRAVVVDLDTLAVGDPAIDVGNFLAHLDVARLDGERCADDEFFLGMYREWLAVDLDAVATYRRAALLRLACLAASTSHRKGHGDRLAELAAS